MSLEVRPLENVGVEVYGFDINDPIDDATKAELEALWLEHAILLFRDQDIDARKQIEFSAIFGELERHPLEVKIESDHPELFVLEAGSNPARDAAETSYWNGEPIVGRLDWHMDLHYTAKPNRGALIRAVTVAEKDGATGFGDLAKAYDALDADTRARLEGLEVAYVFEMQRRNWRFVDLTGYEPGPNSPKKPSDVGFPDFPDSIYPLVVTHPVSGRRVLEVVEQFLDRIENAEAMGLSRDEADDLLTRLVEHTRNPAFHYIHDWREGDMVLWDNWRAMHCARGCPPGTKRKIHRTTIAGDRALGRALAS
ncbi:MAG: TauD/TfdA family dioxygenase [Myxococcota bacterium]